MSSDEAYDFSIKTAFDNHKIIIWKLSIQRNEILVFFFHQNNTCMIDAR